MNQLIGYLSEGEQLKGSLTIPKTRGGGGGGTLETITKTYTPTTSQQTEQITPSSGYDGIAEVDVIVDAMPTGTEGTPTATKGTVSNHSVNVTPSVTNQAGYIAGGTKTGTSVTVSASELVSGTKSITANGSGIDVTNYEDVDVAVPNSYSAGDEGKVVSNGALVAQTAHADVTPTTSDQTIDTTTNNSIKVKGDADLVAANIKKDVAIFGVTGSYEGGGGGHARQAFYLKFFPTTTLTNQNRLTLQVEASSNCYIIVRAINFPTADATQYKALIWGINVTSFDSTHSYSDNVHRILRPNGTIGTDGAQCTYTASTGVLKIGGEYGHYLPEDEYEVIQVVFE